MRGSPRRRTVRNSGRRTVLALAVALFALAGVGLTPGLATAAKAHDSQTACAAAGSGTTCSGTYDGDTSWDPNVINPDGSQGAQSGITPTVTVDQTQALTNQMVHVSWQGFTPSVNNSTGIGFSVTWTQYAVGLYECKGTDPQLDKFTGTATSGDCYTIYDQKFASDGPVNAVRTFTQPDPNGGADGAGSADFQVETAQQNAFLGCDDTHPCSLVVVPNWGGAGNDGSGDCTDHSLDGGLPFGSSESYDDFLGAPCSWADRIVVPLSFAPTPKQFCPPSNYQFAAEGAPSLEWAMDQWRPAWCVDQQNPLSFDYDSSVDEYQARSDFLNGNGALSSAADVALVNQPASAEQQGASQQKFTYAPVVDSAISVVYYVDDQKTGDQVTNLTLDARLVAKLLTQSYALGYGNCTGKETAQTATCDPAVAGNALDLFHDPEFRQLNPQFDDGDFQPAVPQNTSATFLPIVLAGNSDMTFAVTRWLESDPDASAFLAGQPDQWHMHVNTYYKDLGYPIQQFLPEDPGWTDQPPDAALESMQLSWNPVHGLDNVTHDLAGNTSTALTNFGIGCSDPTWHGGACNGNWTYPNVGVQPLGQRQLMAIVDQGSAAAFRFPTAKLVNPAGNAVAPTTASMTAALNTMATNPDKITQFQDYGSTSAQAYPLTTVEYAMLPTCGVDAGKASAISQFLGKVGGSAQIYGTDPGQLPPFGGYLALTAAQKAQVQTAAGLVSSQSCTSPPPDTTVDGTTPAGSGGGAGGGGSAGSGGGATGGSPADAAGPPSGKTSPAGAAGPKSVPVGLKAADTGGFAGLVLPLALSVAGLMLVLGLGAYLLTATAAGRALLARVRGRSGDAA
jgi:hypothetical protein